MNKIISNDDGLIREAEFGVLADHVDSMTTDEALRETCGVLMRLGVRLSNPIAARFAKKAADLADCARRVEYCSDLDSFLRDIEI